MSGFINREQRVAFEVYSRTVIVCTCRCCVCERKYLVEKGVLKLVERTFEDNAGKFEWLSDVHLLRMRLIGVMITTERAQWLLLANDVDNGTKPTKNRRIPFKCCASEFRTPEARKRCERKKTNTWIAPVVCSNQSPAYASRILTALQIRWRSPTRRKLLRIFAFRNFSFIFTKTKTIRK